MANFMDKTLSTEYKGRSIILKNNWLNGCRVIVDGELIHHDKRFFHLNRDKPFFEFDLKTDDGIEGVAVFVEAIWDINLLVQINGETIARTGESKRVVV